LVLAALRLASQPGVKHKRQKKVEEEVHSSSSLATHRSLPPRLLRVGAAPWTREPLIVGRAICRRSSEPRRGEPTPIARALLDSRAARGGSRFDGGNYSVAHYHHNHLTPPTPHSDRWFLRRRRLPNAESIEQGRPLLRSPAGCTAAAAKSHCTARTHWTV